MKNRESKLRTQNLTLVIADSKTPEYALFPTQSHIKHLHASKIMNLLLSAALAIIIARKIPF